MAQPIDMPLDLSRKVTVGLSVKKYENGVHVDTIVVDPRELEGEVGQAIIAAMLRNPEVRAQLEAQQP